MAPPPGRVKIVASRRPVLYPDTLLFDIRQAVTMVDTTTKAPHTVKLSVTTMTMMVVGSMVGAGVFSLPSRFAGQTGVAGSLVAWLIAGVGMLMLAFVFQNLAIRKPDLDSGVYAYAKAEF